MLLINPKIAKGVHHGLAEARRGKGMACAFYLLPHCLIRVLSGIRGPLFPRSSSCRRVSVVSLFLALLSISLAHAEDRVVVQNADSSTKRTLTGEIVDYNGKELRVQLATGQAMNVPAARVMQVESAWQAQHEAADRLRDERKYTEAIDAYRQALRTESRTWAKRRIMADAVTAYESLGQFDRAGDAFAVLMQADEHWQYLERAPLAWLSSGLADARLEQRAQTWLASELAPVQLLGASWSLSSPQRTQAVNTLRKLSNHTDARIAHLADAQLWRANITTVGPQELAAWEAQILRMPANLRGGPCLVLGRGWLQQNARMLGNEEMVLRRAVIAFMQAPVMHADRPLIAMQGLEQAAVVLEQLQWKDEATSVLRELARDFADTDAGRAAAAKLPRDTARP
jgi:tetratricopeptide (TPR) repeat protein